MTVTLQHVAALCNRLSAIGRAAYTQAADGFFDVAMPHQTTDKTPELRDLYNANTKRWPELNAEIETDLKSAGFESYSYLARSQGTLMLIGHHANGHQYALRTSVKTDEQRIVSPMVTRAYYTRLTGGLMFDVTPAIQILQLNDSDTPNAQNPYMLAPEDDDVNEALEHVLDSVLITFMNAASCKADDPISKDFGVMPDGTPIQPDPGQIRYLFSDKLEPERVDLSLRRFYHLTWTNDLAQPLRWFEPDGSWKQDKFFANPYARANYRSGHTPLT